MKLTAIENLWEGDKEIDGQKLDTEALDIPKLYNKYMRIQNGVALEISVIEASQAAMKMEKTKYYKGWCDKPYAKKIVVAEDLRTFIAGDKEVILLNAKLYDANLRFKTLDRILKQIENRSFHIKTALDYRKFIEGGY